MNRIDSRLVTVAKLEIEVQAAPSDRIGLA